MKNVRELHSVRVCVMRKEGRKEGVGVQAGSGCLSPLIGILLKTLFKKSWGLKLKAPVSPLLRVCFFDDC